jgi:hypothetical protein
MKGLSLVIDAVNVILRHLDEGPDGLEARELRSKALDYINEGLLWKDARPRPSVETREALMKKVLALHVAVRRLEVPAASAQRETAPRASAPSSAPPPS